MAKAAEPRPRVASAAFGVYAVVLLVVTYLLSPQIAPYVDPGATFWISTAYMLLGAVALAGICGGALVRARKLEDRIDQLEALRRRVQEIESGGKPVTDSGSAEQEVEALLDGFTSIGAPGARAGDSKASAVDDVLRDEIWEMGRLRRARDSVGVAALGPALAAAGLLGAFAPLLPASDGMLLNLQLAAFAGVAGLGWLVGLPVYAVAEFRQVRVHT